MIMNDAVAATRFGHMPAQRAAVLEGLGGYLPPRRVTNAELCERLDTSDAWIRSHLGIRTRHLAEGEATVGLAVQASKRALASAGGGGVDVVVLATTTPDRMCPASAPEVASGLGMAGTAAYDVSSACSGFIYALATGSSLIVAGLADRVLVVGADVVTTMVDPDDRLTSVIFGDGAGAVVLRAGRPFELGAVGPFDLGSDGSLVHLLEVPGGGGREKKGLSDGHVEPYLLMAGREVFERAVTGMEATTRRVVDRAGWKMESVDRLVAHQANGRILTAVADRLGLAPDQCPSNIDAVGNTAAASIPLALAHAHDSGLMKPGHQVVLAAFGAGLAWGAGALTWPDLPSGGAL